MKEVILLVGPSGIGKTTWAKANYPDTLRVNPDEDTTHLKTFLAAVEAGTERIIVDNTGRDRDMRSWYIKPAREHGYRVRAVVFDCGDIQALLARAAARAKAEGIPPQNQVQAVMFYLSVCQPLGKDEVDEVTVVPLT